MVNSDLNYLTKMEKLLKLIFFIIFIFLFTNISAQNFKTKVLRNELIVFNDENISKSDFQKYISEEYKNQFGSINNLNFECSAYNSKLWLIKGDNISMLKMPNPKLLICPNKTITKPPKYYPPGGEIECQPCPSDTLIKNVRAIIIANKLPRNLTTGSCIRNCCCPKQQTYLEYIEDETTFSYYDSFAKSLTFKNLTTLVIFSNIEFENCPVMDKILTKDAMSQISVVFY